MTQKTFKFLIKSAYVLPAGLLFANLTASGSFTGNFLTVFAPFHLLAAVLFAFGWVFFGHMFAYEKYNGMPMADFLESHHSICLQNDDGVWEDLNRVLTQQLTANKVLIKTVDVVEVELDRKFINSIIRLQQMDTEVMVSIKRKFLGFLPDQAANYRALQKLVKGKALSTMVYP